MDRERVRSLCAAQPGAQETYPFGPINLKCDPEWSEVLRNAYPAVVPGYHQNKKHWNTITLDGSIPDDEIVELIQHSYELVTARRGGARGGGRGASKGTR